MKKADLRTGMRVTLRDGERYIVLLNFNHKYNNETDILLDGSGRRSYYSLNNYNEFLRNLTYPDADIITVEQPEHAYALFRKDYEFNIIWERPEPKKMTLTEIEFELGYPVKIIGG